MPNFRSPPMPCRVVGQHRRHRPVGGHAHEPVRLQFHVAAARGNLQAFEGARGRDLEDAAEGGERSRHRGEVRPLVLPSDDPPEVDSPRLVAPGRIAQRLERNRHLDGPSAVEAPGLHVPHGVPVVVGRTLIGDLPVREPANRVGVKDVAVALVVEGVEEHREVVVLPQLRRVSPHLVGHAALGVRLEAPSRDVNVVVIEEDPRLGLLGGRLELVRLLLDEPADRFDGGVDRLVELPVDMDRIGHAVAAHRGRSRLSGGAGPRREKNDDERDHGECEPYVATNPNQRVNASQVEYRNRPAREQRRFQYRARRRGRELDRAGAVDLRYELLRDRPDDTRRRARHATPRVWSHHQHRLSAGFPAGAVHGALCRNQARHRRVFGIARP